MIRIGLKNPPAGAYYWVCALYAGYEVKSSDYLALSETWASPWYGTVDVRIITYYSNKSVIGSRDLYSVTLEDNHDYAYNWATNQWEDITAVVGWIQLATMTLAISKTAVPGWVQLATTSLPIKAGVTYGWIELAETSLPIKASIIFGWIELATISLAVAVSGLPPPPPTCETDEDCPEGYVCVDGVCIPEEAKKEFPWLPVALIGGGVVVAIAAATKPKKKVAK